MPLTHQSKALEINQWLDILENRHVNEIQLGLSRITQVAERLSLTLPKAKVITVAGTNGKGSTVAALEAIYLAAGYQVASYTSPHLLRFNERIRINQKPISDEHLCKAFAFIEEGRGDIPLTYFEISTLAALWYFKQQNLDLVILEVGLGGRLDATNIIDADLAIITTIDFDHQEYLGNTKEAIGFEKAGILRENKPLVFADHNPPQSIIKQTQHLNVPIYQLGVDYQYYLLDESIKFSWLKQTLYLPNTSLHLNSLCAALMASYLLKDQLPFDYLHWKQALELLSLDGRLQLIKSKFTTLLDVSHNPQAVKYLASFINRLQPKGAVHAVFSAFKDKDLPGLVSPLKDLVDYWYPATLTNKRAASREQLIGALGLNSAEFICYNDPVSAYQAACQQADTDDLIVVYGSFITVGQVLPVVDKELL